MSKYLSFDTSNYTTSVCLYDDETNQMLQKRRLLPVAQGAVGLRQSDTVFHHTQRLVGLIEELFSETDCDISDICAFSASFTPRSEKGSYMPCFTVGSTTARILAQVARKPLYSFSHQQGHIASALFSADRLDLLYKPFIAFHVSGGTTEALLVNGSMNNKAKAFPELLPVKIVGKTLDLNAGQLVDRVGVKLGLSFPCGKELEKLALCCKEDIKIKPTVKNTDCCLSGVENICQKLIDSGTDKSYIAALCLKYIEQSLFVMAKNIRSIYGELPLVFAGGVMSDSIIRSFMLKHLDCDFCEPQYSTDNACGIALLTAISHRLKES